jgi:hypothetical protein
VAPAGEQHDRKEVQVGRAQPVDQVRCSGDAKYVVNQALLGRKEEVDDKANDGQGQDNRQEEDALVQAQATDFTVEQDRQKDAGLEVSQ